MRLTLASRTPARFPVARPALARLGLVAVALAAAPAAYADEAQDKAVVSGVVSRFLVPGYDALARAAAANASAWSAYCAAPDATRLAALRAAHRALALSYGEVQAFRFGPAGEGANAERLYFWPERKNATAKGLAILLSGSEPVTPERVARASAAAQGIPALERLAYADGSAMPGAADPAARRSCTAAVAVAGGVANLTESIAGAWNKPDTGYAARIGRGDLDPALAPSTQQAASELVTGFMTGLAVIQDQKVEPVLGTDIEHARPGAAEARLSGLTVEMILANIKGLQDFVAALDGAVAPLQLRSWQALLMRLKQQAEAVRDYPDGVTDPDKRQTAENLLGRLKSIRAIFNTEVPAALGLKLGFNGLDGD